MTCLLVPARLTHVGPIATRMRADDRIECEALGRTPKDALRGGLRTSLSAYTAIADGKPFAMIGAVPVSLLSGAGTIWMLGTDDVYRHGRDLLTYGPLLIDMWLKDMSRLENVVAVSNVKAIRLLERLGFTIGEKTQTHGGVKFLPFWIGRDSGPHHERSNKLAAEPQRAKGFISPSAVAHLHSLPPLV